jgi:hypothetical protein
MADLFDVDDLAALLQRTFTETEAAAAAVAQANVTARLNKMCGRSFDGVIAETVTLRSNGRFIQLPKRPVTAVTSIYTVASDGTADELMSGWVFDGIDVIDLASASPQGLEVVSHPGTIPYRVTYSHGYATPPADISGIALKMAVGEVENPEGHQMERVDDYMFQRSGPGLSGLSDDDRRIIADYARRTGSMQVAR